MILLSTETGREARRFSVPGIAGISGAGVAPAPIDADSTIFVVHGRDHEARDQLELILRRLGLAPYVLQVTGGRWRHAY